MVLQNESVIMLVIRTVKKIITLFWLALAAAVLFLLPEIVLAQAEPGFKLLVELPYLEDLKDGTPEIGSYVNALYLMAISIAAFLAVVKIIYSGVLYMLSDVITTKEEAKKGIWGALFGLLIVIGAVLILETINPQLTNLQVLDGERLYLTTSSKELLAEREIEIKIEETCASYGEDNCEVMSCDFVESSGYLAELPIYGLLVDVTDAVINSASCEVRCGAFRGDVIDGNCYYPEDAAEAAAEAEAEYLSETTEELTGIEIDCVVGEIPVYTVGNTATCYVGSETDLLNEIAITDPTLPADFTFSTIPMYSYLENDIARMKEDGLLDLTFDQITGMAFVPMISESGEIVDSSTIISDSLSVQR